MGARVLAVTRTCPQCGSTKIKRSTRNSLSHPKNEHWFLQLGKTTLCLDCRFAKYLFHLVKRGSTDNLFVGLAILGTIRHKGRRELRRAWVSESEGILFQQTLAFQHHLCFASLPCWPIVHAFRVAAATETQTPD